MNHKDSKLKFKIMKKIMELRLRWYEDCDGVVRTYWNGKWVPWEDVAKMDKRLEVE